MDGEVIIDVRWGMGGSVLLTLFVLSSGHLSQVAEVVSLHLQVEDFTVSGRSVGNQMFVEQVLQVRACNTWIEMCGTRPRQ